MPVPKHPALPYVLPMAGFLLLTSLEGYLPAREHGPHPLWYPLAYTVKVVVVSALAWYSRSAWRDLTPRPPARVLALAAVLGVVIAALWVGLDGRYPALPFLGKRSEFDPHLLPPAGFWAFVAVRMYGLVLLVPLMEELFWRSFLMRWVIDLDHFETVPIGRVTPLAAVVTSALFGFAHPEWLPGLITGCAWAWLVWQTRSILACVVSHLVANLALGLYVLQSGEWKYW